MKTRTWFNKRGPHYLSERLPALLARYSWSANKAKARILRISETLIENGCRPTYPTPGSVVESEPVFIHELQARGVELAVHGFDHIDMRACSPQQARDQMVRAVKTFSENAICVHGFRCPYLSASQALFDALPKGLFEYSSNLPITLQSMSNPIAPQGKVFQVLDTFYQPRPNRDFPCVPFFITDLLEIPVIVPDDIQLHDGLNAGAEGMFHSWEKNLAETYARGELDTLLFHLELGGECSEPFRNLLQRAREYSPRVWIAPLCDISSWWRAKNSFGVELVGFGDTLRIHFECSEHATILARGLEQVNNASAWDDAYVQIQARVLDIPRTSLPFVGLTGAAQQAQVFLCEQGYIVLSDERARHCAICLSENDFKRDTTQMELLTRIEQSPGPLLRYGRWPDGCKSALAITGDLDALSLMDYAARFLK